MHATQTENTQNRKFKGRISIAVFLTIASLALMFFVAWAGYESLSHINAIANFSEQVRKKSLPELVENQRTFMSIESLRRLAEVAYVSDDPQVLRTARINAQALATESVFLRDEGFYEKAMLLSKVVSQLANSKQLIGEKIAAERAAADAFRNKLEESIEGAVDQVLLHKAFAAFFRSSLSDPNINFVDRSREKLSEVEGQDKDLLPAVEALCAVQERRRALPFSCSDFAKDYTAFKKAKSEVISTIQLTHSQWKTIDDTLREMRDNVGTESEMVTKDSLAAIEGVVNEVHSSFYIIVSATALAVLFFLFLMHWLVVNPIRSIAQKLKNFQYGDLSGALPAFRIRELNELGHTIGQLSTHLAGLYSHTSQLEQDAASKIELEEIMSALFKVSPDGYMIWDSEAIRLVSPGLCKSLGVEDPNLVLQDPERFNIMVFSDRRWIFEEILAQGMYREEFLLYNPRGELLPCEVTHLKVDSRGKTVILSYIRDLRQQKRIEEVLREAKEEAEFGAQAKSDFLARMSHEIRTPMNGVLGITQLALEKDPAQEQKEYLLKIQASANILLGVINDILDFSKIESGKMTLDSAAFSLRKMLQTVSDLFRPLAAQKHIEFRLDLGDSVYDYYFGDALRISQVLLNLCSNAIKFTPKGIVTLSITLAAPATNFIYLRFSVTDTGVGMTQEQLSRLFQPFAQADTSTTRKYGGTGLGLVISKMLVEMMGGRIEVHSVPGEGSSFYFVLPMEKASADEVTLTEAAPRAHVSFEGASVLLVEDNEINQEIAVAMLENLDITVFVANNGQEALDFLAENDVNGVLMDIQMPVMDGLTAARHIRAEGRLSTRFLPIIAMTAHAMQEDRDKSFQAGMNDHITKPIDGEELKSVLLRWIKI